MPNVPTSGSGFVFTVSLFAVSDGQVLLNPTLASGDVKISTDGGALANLTSLPSVSPSGSGIVEVSLTSAEVGSNHFTVIFSDASGGEWLDLYYHEVISNASSGGGGGGSSTVYADGILDMTIEGDELLVMEIDSDEVLELELKRND